ncbi:MAG: selenide, water dikinase SelD [Oscillatoriales cyanobacterium C42_A2020_001]|nr:selenide, water dikinase SelD [Leptolyngbyaceae cyanobacterium C42_A2020_001]
MQSTIEPVVKDLVLIGGGHVHAIALRMFGMKPLPGVRITLISEASESAYSGMLPGRVANLYTDEKCHVNLCALADFAGAQFYIDQVTNLDLEHKQVICAHHPPIAFDVLSIDIGSTPSLPEGIRDQKGVIPAKPVRAFLDRWDELIDRVSRHPETPVRLGIVGGGAAGVELSLSMHRRIQEILRAAHQPSTNLEIHLIHRGPQLVPQFNLWVCHCLRSLLAQRHIHLHLNEEVETVEAHSIRCKSGFEVTCDAIVWVTQASAPDWLSKTGLTTDEKGFVLVNDALQSLNYPFVFAVGDVATMINHPRPKAGVFAVRQGKPLVRNLRRFLQNQPLKPFHPQKRYLSLLNTADGAAVAAWGRLGWRSPLLWRWKDHIDQRFMQRLNHLPSMPAPSPSPPPLSPMPCAGCGSKVGSNVLSRVLNRIQQTSHAPSPQILIGLEDPDDAAVIQIPAGQVMVQTVDYFTTLIHDPFVFGQISANHSLSDLYAMGATPHSALAIATVPYGAAAPVEESLYQLLSGAVQVLNDAGAVLIGGHTTEGAELAFGVACNGLAPESALLRKGGMQPGQALILTKPLGTGTLFAAKMQRKALGRWIDQAVESMLRSNQQASRCLLEHHATACTDVTGFGLVGHLVEMVQASNVAVKLHLESLPILPGALQTARIGILSSLQPQNLRACQFIDNWESVSVLPQFQLLFDPQTSGGLLAAVPQEHAIACLQQLKASGYPSSAIIGETVPLQVGRSPISLVGL